MNKGDLITVALIIANVACASLLMVNGQFAKVPPVGAVQAVQPLPASPGPNSPNATIRPTSTPSPTMVLAINTDVTILNTPVNVCNPISIDPAPAPTKKPPTPTPTPVPKPDVKTGHVHKARAVPTIRPSATPAPNFNLENEAAKIV